MLEVELYKVVDAGHFWCKPSSRNRTEAENYYTIIGKINDYCCKAEKQASNQKSKIPKKGKLCLVKRTSDRCWYRAKVLSIFQTINGPQARVLLVDLGERTLVPGIWIQEIPEEFINISYQTMECVLSGLKPLTMVTSYFDLTTKKQPGDTWDVSATDWLKEQISGKNLQLDVKHIDEDGIHHVLLFAASSDAMICLNDELVNNEYAVLSKLLPTNQDEKNSSSSKADLQDSFSEELKKMKEKLSSSLSLNDEGSSNLGEEPLGSEKRSKYQPLTWSDESEGSTQGSENEFGKQPISAKDYRGRISTHYSGDDEKSKVRFMSARLPATGSNDLQSLGGKQPKPILKHSSGYSSSEDSHKDIYNHRRVPKHVTGFSKGVSSITHYENAFCDPKISSQDSQRNAFGQQGQLSYLRGELNTPSLATAHDQSADVTSQRKSVYSNSISGNDQNFHTYNEDSQKNSQTDMPARGPPIKGAQGNCAHVQKAAHMVDDYNKTHGQIISNIDSTFSRQNVHNGLKTNTVQYPSSGSSTSSMDNKNIPNTGSTFPRQTGHNQYSSHPYSMTSNASTFARQTIENRGTHSGYSTPLTNQSNAGSTLVGQQNIQSGLQTTSGQHSGLGQYSGPGQHLGSGQHSGSVQHPGSGQYLGSGQHPGSGQHLGSGQYSGSGQHSVSGQHSGSGQYSGFGQHSGSGQHSGFGQHLGSGQHSGFDQHSGPGQYSGSGQHEVSSATVHQKMAKRNQNEFQSNQFSSSHSFVQNSNAIYPAISSNQQQQVLPGNNQNVPNDQRFEPSANKSSSNTQQHVNQNLPQRPPSNGPPSSYQNGPPHNPNNPPASLIHKHPQSTKIPYSLTQTSYSPSSQGSIQSSSLRNSQQPPQNISQQTSRYVPITPQSHQQPISPVQSINVSCSQLQQENFVRTANRNTLANTVPNVPHSQAQSTTIPQHGTGQSVQQNQLKNNQNSTSNYSNVSTYQGQSKAVPSLREENIHGTQTQRFPTNPSMSVNGPINQARSTNAAFSQSNQSKLPPVIQQQSRELPPTQSQYNPVGTSVYTNVPNRQVQSTCVSQDQLQNHSPRQPQYNSLGMSGSQSVPGTRVHSSTPPQSCIQRQSISATQVPYASSSTSEYPNVPISTFYTYHVSTNPQQSTSTPPVMAQSLDIHSETVPSQCVPTGETLSGIHNNQVLSHVANNDYSSSASEIPENTTTFPPKQVSPKRSQHIHNNRVQSSNYQPSSTTQQDSVPLTPALSTPRSPVQTPSTLPSPTKSPRILSSPMPDAKLCHVIGDVIVHGMFVPKTEFDLKIYPDGLQRGLRDLGVTKPSSFQVNLWSAIIRGRDVFGIPETSSDNVMAYLAPVISLLAEPTTYSKLPMGNGALALFLCQGWQKATTVYEQCRKFTKHLRNIRVQIVYGGGAEDECIPGLINGCEVLIATLPCLLRMLKRKCTRLDRLCHIVFDEADILAEEQTDCVKELMRDFGTLLQAQPGRQAPRQCIAIGNKWTTGVCSLVKVYLGNPVVVIGNQIEAAMFCNVRQIINYVSSSKRESELLSLLDKYTLNNEHEIIIFTSTAKDAERLAQMLEYYSFTILLAHEFLWPEQLLEIRRQWNTPHSSDSFLILVMTDGVIDKCNIRTATLVIHYDSAPTKKLFGKRMFCMATSYPSTEEKECLSLTIGTEHSTACARSIKELAVRSSGIVPPTLEKVCELAYQEKEEKKKNDELCTYLKAFGQCKDLLQCKSRHTVFPDFDISLLLPKSGIVKVLILAVLDASRYFVRILDHQSDSKEVDSTNYYSGATFLKLALDLNTVYTSRDNRHVCSRIHLQKLCVVESEGSFYRAKIIQVVRKDSETNRALEVQVYFIDRGFYEVIPSFNLFEIAPQFVDIPYQAVEAYVCRIKPLDNDKHWTNKAVRYVAQHIEGQELEGRVLMGLRNTIWLDPLVVKEHLKEINVTTNSFNVRLDLLKEGFAVHNQEHVENLKKHFTTFVRVKDITGHDSSDGSACSGQTQTCTLPEQDFAIVKVSSILSPELIYVRLEANSNSLEDLADQINEDINSQPKTNHEDFSIGSLCLAKFTDDERWYRAKILSIRPEGEYDVFFMDYGDRQWITQDRIVPMRPEYLQLPFQAIECSLVNISPVGTEWTEDAVEGLWNLVEDKVLMEDKLLHAEVKSKSTAMLTGMCRYGIELWDTSTERDILVNHELVIAGYAQATLEYNKTLFPEAFDSNTSGHPKEQFEEIPTLCLQLYKAQDPNAKLRYAQEIKNIVSENMKKKDDIRESGGVRCICRLLGVSKNEEVQEYVVIALAFLATQNDLNCEEIRREGGLKILCDLLNKAKNVKVQEHSAWALKILASSERNRDATREIGGIKNLCDLLASTDQEKVQENICWAIVSLCSDNNNNCDAIREAGGVSTLLKLLETSRSNSVLENTMWAISLLAYNASNKTWIGQQGGIEKIFHLIQRNQDEKVLQNAVRSLKTLSSYNDDNREIMCRLGIIDLMRRLSNVQTQLPFDIRRTCLDLIQRLLGRAPDVPLIEASSITSPLQEPIKCKPIAVTKRRKPQENGKIVNGDDESDDDIPLLEDTAELGLPTVHPMTMWSQTKRSVSLSIKLRGVEQKNSKITKNNFYFRTRHLEKLYELNLELFADVIPKESKVHLRGSEVLVSLKKAQPVKWLRLLSTAEKPPFLSVDFDRWNTDSGCEEEYEQKQPIAPATSTKKEGKNWFRPFDDEQNDSSELSSDEEPSERIGFDFS